MSFLFNAAILELNISFLIWKKTQVKVVKRKRTFLRTGSIIKPEETYVSLAGGGPLILVI